MENTVKGSEIFEGMTREEAVQEVEENKPVYASLAAIILDFAQEGVKKLNPTATPVEVLIGAWKQIYSNAIANGDKDDAEVIKNAGKKHYYASIKKEPSEQLEKLFERTWKTIKVEK